MSQFRRRLMMMAGAGSSPTPPPSPLPPGAIPCELIYSDGYGGFIDSGIVPGISASYEADFISVRPDITASTLFGYMINSRRYSPVRIDGTSGAYMEIAFDSYYQTTLGFPYRVAKLKAKAKVTQLGGRIELYLNGNLYGAADKTYSETDFTPSQTMALLGRKSGANSIDSGSFRGGLKELKCYDDDNYGNLVAHFIGCYYNGSFGFWDTVNEVFKTGSNIYGFGATWNTAGFIPNVNNSTISSTPDSEYNCLIDYRGKVATPLFEIPQGCSTIQFNAGTVQSGESYALMFLNSNKAYMDYWNYNTADRVVSVPSGAVYMRMAMPRDTVNDCYIYDVTNSQYIWKGFNIL